MLTLECRDGRRIHERLARHHAVNLTLICSPIIFLNRVLTITKLIIFLNVANICGQTLKVPFFCRGAQSKHELRRPEDLVHLENHI